MPTEPTLAAIRERFADEMWPWGAGGGGYYTTDDIRADVAILLSTIAKQQKVIEAARELNESRLERTRNAAWYKLQAALGAIEGNRA